MIDRLLHKPGTTQLGLVTLLALPAHLLASAWLNDSYARSGFPVPYQVAQLSFSAAQLKGWYGQLIEQGSFEVYLHTQYIDHVFIFTVLVLHLAALLWVSRLFPAGHRARRWMVFAALGSAVAPLADTLENGVSYLMLADPAGFAPGLALLYSSLAALKFAAFTFAYLALGVGGVAGCRVRWSTAQPLDRGCEAG